MSEDNSVMEAKLDNIIILLTSMNKKLGNLLAYIGAKAIVDKLKAEDKVDKSVSNTQKELDESKEREASVIGTPSAESKALPVVKEVQIETTETVLMTPNEVTIIAKTPKSLLVTKKGFQKWIAFSLMENISEEDYETGEYIETITINEERRKWFNEVKGWDKLVVKKN